MSEYVNIPSETMDWDDEISNDGRESILLPEGDYVFTVVDSERGWQDSSAKIPNGCNKAILKLELDTAEGAVQITENLLLLRSMEWKTAAFFRSIGQKKHGETMKPKWNEVKGSQGIAHINQREYTGNDGQKRKANNVAYFIDHNPEMIRSILEAKVNAIDEDIPF